MLFATELVHHALGFAPATKNHNVIALDTNVTSIGDNIQIPNRSDSAPVMLLSCQLRPSHDAAKWGRAGYGDPD